LLLFSFETSIDKVISLLYYPKSSSPVRNPVSYLKDLNKWIKTKLLRRFQLPRRA